MNAYPPVPRRARPLALGLGLAALCFVSLPLRAQEEKLEPIDGVAQAFVSLFNGTCVKFYRSPDKLTAEMTAKGAPAVDAEHSGPFLHDTAGQAWSVSDGHGEFVVALTATGVCSVFAHRAKDVDVQLLFATLVQGIQVPDAPMVKVADKRADTPQGATHYVAFAQQRKTPGPFARFGLTTTASETVAIQALATLSTAERK